MALTAASWRGVNTLLAIEAHGARNAAGALEAGGVLISRIGAVQAAQSVSARRSHNGVHHRVPAMPGIDLVVLVGFADIRRRACAWTRR